MNPALLLTANNAAKNKYVQWLIKFIVILIILWIIYKVYEKFKFKINSAIRNNQLKKDLDAVVSNQGSDPDAHVSGNVRTYTDADYKLMADSLFTAMDGIGTDVSTIYNVLNALRTKADWHALLEAFGIRRTSWTTWSDFEGSLTKWLTDELKSREKQKVNNILSKFGVGRI